jgi:hypothetical protein
MRLDMWPNFAVAAAALLLTGALAIRRSRLAAKEPRHRLVRICAAAAIFAISMAAMFGLHQVVNAYNPRILVNSLAVGLILGVLAIILFGLADVALTPLRPHKSRAWLVVALPLFPTVMIGSLAVISLFFAGQPRLAVETLGPIGVAMSSGLAWWSFLPSKINLASVFD